MPGQSSARLREREEQLYGVATAQSGYFTARQALQSGYAQSLHSYHVKTGRWERVAPGLYRLPTLPNDLEGQYVMIGLWSRNQAGEPQGVFGYETALVLHDLSDVMPRQLHLIVPPTFRKKPLPGLVLHRQTLPAQDTLLRTGYRVTTPLRTLIDIARSPASTEHLQQGLREALARGLVRRSKLESRLAELHEPALTGSARQRLLAALEAA